MALTPNIMMASEGLIANTALAKVTIDTAGYEAQVIVADYAVTAVVFPTLASYLDGTAPYISNSATGSTTAPSYTTFINQHANNIFQDNQRFVLYALIAMGEVETANKYVNAAVNSAALTSQTFTTQDALMTGNLAAVSSDANAWGQELLASGTLFDFKKLDHLGTPQAIIEALLRGNMLGMISDELTTQGLDVVTLKKAIKDNPDLMLTPLVQKRCYYVLQRVDGDKLTDILEMLAFQTTGINSLADLMDLTKVFPTTYTTLTAPKDGTLRPIFTNAGNITDHFSDVVAPLSAVIPDDIAIGNNVFTCSLSQVTGIRNSSPAAIGGVACGIEDNEGLPLTGGLTEALPAATAASIIAQNGGGTGPNSTFYLTDFLGAAAAIPFNDNFGIINNHLTAIQSAGGFDDMAEILDLMRDVIDGNAIGGCLAKANVCDKYEDDPGNPGTDIYDRTEIPNRDVPYELYPIIGAVTMDVGEQYEIKSVGDSDFTLHGAPNNNIGTIFTATSIGIGTGTVEIVNPLPAYGVYSSQSDALDALLLELDTVVADYIAAYPTEHVEMLAAFNTTISGTIGAIERFWDANVRFAVTYHPPNETGSTDGLPANKSSTLLFAENLPIYGKKTDKGNIAEILEVMVTNTLGGNAIIAAMREGRNAAKISGAGIKSDHNISEKPTTVEPGNIS